ncbi:MAG: CHRD domain-containing protein [Acidimicrobiia bacterium]
MKATTKAGAVGTALGLSALALLMPTIASGNARNTGTGPGAAEAAVARPFLAQLTGANEVPPADPDGDGAAAITIDPVAGNACFDLRVAGIDTATAAHIHEGAAGVNGGIVVTLTPPTPTSSGCVPVDPALATLITTTPANYYVNVHNAAFPAGAVRGQLALSASATGDMRLLDTPLRAYDSRIATAGGIAAGETRVISLGSGVDGAAASKVAVPPGAVAAVVKLTVTDTQGAGGFLKIYSNALTTEPATASVNWAGPNAIIGETGPVAVDAEAKVKVTAGVNGTHFVIDVVGFVY